MGKKNTSFQLVPPHDHISNDTEQAIQTCKSHSKTGLSSADKDWKIEQKRTIAHYSKPSSSLHPHCSLWNEK